jgi:tRNA pseudouridine55 synthase
MRHRLAPPICACAALESLQPRALTLIDLCQSVHDECGGGDNSGMSHDQRQPDAETSTKPRRVALNGVLLLDKPAGISSNQALGWAKRLLQAAKAGHTGTLDPFATGLLPVCFGEATKFSADLTDADKTYIATMQLGARTTTGDIEGEVIERQPCVRPEVDRDAWLRAALAQFVGEIAQVPPMYSALKRDGKPLYEYARAGIELERAARPVTVYALDLVSQPAPDQVVFSVTCSKGTYVRTLAEDIARALGTVAHLVALRRTRIVSPHTTLSIEDAHGLDILEALPVESRMERLLPADTLVQSLPTRVIEPWQAVKIRHGQSIAVPEPAPRERLYTQAGGFLGVAARTREGAGENWGAIRVERLVVGA